MSDVETRFDLTSGLIPPPDYEAERRRADTSRYFLEGVALPPDTLLRYADFQGIAGYAKCAVQIWAKGQNPHQLSSTALPLFVQAWNLRLQDIFHTSESGLWYRCDILLHFRPLFAGWQLFTIDWLQIKSVRVYWAYTLPAITYLLHGLEYVVGKWSPPLLAEQREYAQRLAEFCDVCTTL